jgi:hypothetical protein
MELSDATEKKSSVTPPGIDPGTFLLVAQCLNHYATPGPTILCTCELLTRHAMYVLRNIEARSCYHCCSGKLVCITHSECVFCSLCIQHAMRVCRTILSYVACPVLQYFVTLSHKRHDLREKIY